MPIILASGLTWFMSTLLNLIVMARFGHKNLDIIERYLSDCPGVINTRNIWGGGIIGRHMRLSMIFAFMYMPGIMYRRGDITENAHLNIPRSLRRRIWAIYIWLLLNCGCLAILNYAITTS